MSYRDPPGWPEPAEPGHDDEYPGRRRPRHLDVAREDGREPGLDRNVQVDGLPTEFGRPNRRAQPRRRGERPSAASSPILVPEGPDTVPAADRADDAAATDVISMPDFRAADATTELVAVPAYPPADAPTDGPPGPGARPDAPSGPDARPDMPSGPGAAPAGESADTPVKPPGRAGRDLRAAIGVGLTLGAVVIASLLVWRPAFLGVAVVAICVATWELTRAVRPSGARPPLVPLVAGGVAMTALAWFGGAEALTLGLVATVVAALVWRMADGPAGYHRDLLAAVLIAVYVPFLGGFAVLLLRPEDGALRVVAALAGVVLSDTGGYVAGVLLGRHPMAPTVSPKKSWEGFVGSLLASAVGGAVLLYLMLDVAPWYGAVFGLCVAAASVLGDFAESLLKRDLGIKDMSNLLPGHGGAMDRLDSVLFAAPMAYAVLALVAPVVT